MDAAILEQQVRHLVALARVKDQAHEDITTQPRIDKEALVRADGVLIQPAQIAAFIFLPWILDTIGMSRYGVHAQEGYTQNGVEALCIGALTHSAPAVDISLRMY